MEFNKNYIATYYTDIKNSKNYPEDFLYELFLIGKISRDNDLVTEISKTLKEYGTIHINNAFKMRNKLPENGQDTTRIIKSFLKYGAKDPLFPIGKLYTMMGFSIFSIDEESIAKELEKQPNLILLLQGITELHIEGVFNIDIPEEFCYISSLKNLEIKGNYKSLPTSIGNLQQLENLTLNLANLESFPSSFWDLKALKELELKNIIKYCQSFFQLNKLERLVKIYLLNINLKDTSLLKLPTSLTEISFIRLDNLSKLPNSIATLKDLEELSVYKCPRLKELPNGLEHLDKLSVIRFEDVPLIKEIKDNQIFTANCSSISLDDDIKVINNGAPLFNSELLIRDPKLLNHVLNNPKNFCNLKSLKIHYINDFYEVTEGFGQLKNLESIEIHQGGNTNILWKNIDKCINLKYLKLYDVNIETLPDGLKNLKNIEFLNFTACRSLTINGNNLPDKLKKLHISEIEEFIPGKHILEINEANFRNLKLKNPKELFSTLITEKLHVKFLNQDEQDPEDLTQYLPKPESLIELKAYTNTCNFKSILKHCTQLKRLYLEKKEKKPSPVYAYPAPKLENLTLHFYKAENLEALLSNMPNLEKIDLEHYDISEAFPEVSLSRLKVLNLSYTSFETLEPLNAPILNTLRIELSYKFGMEGYSKLNQFNNLKKLSLIGISHDVKTVPESITELKLTEFLIGNGIDVFPEYLKKITTLETLSLGGNDFVNIPNWISTLPRLTRLDIDGCQFENSVPESFRSLKLKELKYYIGKFNGGNMPAEKYKYLITPDYTKLRKEFSTQNAD